MEGSQTSDVRYHWGHHGYSHRSSGSRLVEQFRDAGLRVLTTKPAVANARHWCNITGQCDEADALEFGAVCVSV